MLRSQPPSPARHTLSVNLYRQAGTPPPPLSPLKSSRMRKAVAMDSFSDTTSIMGGGGFQPTPPSGSIPAVAATADADVHAAHAISSTAAVSTSRNRGFSLSRAFSLARTVVSSGKAGADYDGPGTWAEIRHQLEMDEHTLSEQEILARLGSDVACGLSSAEAEARLDEHGPNHPPTPHGGSLAWRYVRHLFGGFSLLLWLAALLCFVAWGVLDRESNLVIGVILVVVVVLGSSFTTYHEGDAHDIAGEFGRLQRKISCLVVRDGELKRIDAGHLVVGDVVHLSQGDRVPADVCLLQSSNLLVDLSALTGEEDPQSRSHLSRSDNPLVSRNLLLFPTDVVGGFAVGIVVHTGRNTIFSRLADLAIHEQRAESPFHREIQAFVNRMGLIASIVGAAFFIGGAFSQDIISNLVFAIGIIVANVPEGLLATMVVSLKLTASRMAAKNILVKNLDAIETLGSTSILATDKTGTLTENQLAVSRLWVDGVAMAAAETLPPAVDRGTYNLLLNISVLCNRAELAPDDDDPALHHDPISGALHRKRTLSRITTVTGPVAARDGGEAGDLEQGGGEWAAPGGPKKDVKVIFGDGTDSALVDFYVSQAGRSLERVRETYPSVFTVPFAADRRYMLSIHRATQGASQGSWVVMVKGAPEGVLERCSTIMLDGDERPLTATLRARILQASHEFARGGERVIGMCRMVLRSEQFPADHAFRDDPPNFPVDGYNFVGLASMSDPLRPGVPEAIRRCKQAGIKLIMITGDHPITAEAIARKAGLLTGRAVSDILAAEAEERHHGSSKPTGLVLTGYQLQHMSREQLSYVFDHDEVVFARTSPDQKVHIVQGCQIRNQIIAMTGDGVNDTPALRQANVGIVMGRTGSDVAKDAADMILVDDNFGSIVDGIEEGRLIFSNLKKSIAYTLSSNVPESVPFVVFFILRMPLPLTVILVLCIDLGTDLLPAVSLAYEKPESDLMRRIPRSVDNEELVTPSLISFSYLQIGVMQALGGFFAYLAVLGDFGFYPRQLVGLGPVFLEHDQAINGRAHYYREEALESAQTAFFVSIVLAQVADLLICKTRRRSLGQQGLGNHVLNFALVFEVSLACFLCYYPPLSEALGTRPIAFKHWVYGLPFSVLILLHDELRKYAIRLTPRGGFVDRALHY